MNASDFVIIRKLLEGCEAAKSAFEDHTLSERRINSNIQYLDKTIEEAKKHIHKQLNIK